jgi:DNA-binding CsgD family transcriptional regulator
VRALRPGELVAVGEVLYQRVFALAVWGIGLAAAMAVVAAIGRTREADLPRTAALAVLLIGMSVFLGRNAPRIYRAMRKRPALSLLPASVALLCICLDGINHSPLSFAAGVTVAVAAYAGGVRWGLAAATLLAIGVVGAAAMSGGAPWELDGVDDVPSVVPGAAGYFLYALLVGVLGDRFARLALHLNTIDTPPLHPPLQVPNLASATAPVEPEGEPARSSAEQTVARARPGPAGGPLAKLTARQLQVVLLLAEGLRANEIADRLGVRPKTVYAYVHQATRRTGARNRNELVALAAQAGLLDHTRD